MALNMKLWEICDSKLQEINESKIDKEEQLENWIEKDTSIIGYNILIIGRQVSTSFGGRLDLLAIDELGDLVILELKRDKTPRDVIAQVLDYASWVKKLNYNSISNMALKYLKKELAEVFYDKFGFSIPETINSNHKMIIVASEFDESSQRIVEYLAIEHNVNINAVFFNTFIQKNQKILGRAWLMDPEEIQERSESRNQAPWQGFWFVNVGEGPHRNWDDNIKYNYIGAGQDIKYSRPLSKLKEGAEIFAYMKGIGYVGYGKVLNESVPIKEFKDNKTGKFILKSDVKATKINSYCDDLDKSEYAVKVNWIKTFSRENAKKFKGIFANQNIVCKLRHTETLEYLKREFISS